MGLTRGMRGPSLVRRRSLLVVTVLLTLVTGGCRKAEEKSPAESAPPCRVLLVTVDTLRWDYLSCNGYDRPTTPFLDELIAGGLYFDHAVTPIPRTTQALASLLSGCYPHTTDVRTLDDQMNPDVYSIAQLARYARFRTIAVVSILVVGARRKLNRGFEVYDHATDIRNAALTTGAAIHHLQSIGPQERVFLWVHYIDPHVAYHPPKNYADQFDPDYKGRYQSHFGTVMPGLNAPQFPRDLGKRVAVFRNPLPDEVNAHIRRLYAGDIRHTDDSIGRLVNWLRDYLGPEWIIAFTADHGESLGEHDYFYDHGDYVYQATLRVPLLIALPESHPWHRTGRVDQVVSLVDLAPTLIELMDLSLPPKRAYELEGRSLVPYLRGESLPSRPVFAECGRAFFKKLVHRRQRFDVAGRFRSVTLGEWKLIWTPEQTEEMEYELYHLRDDPYETNNLYTASHPQVAELQHRLFKWLRHTNEEPKEIDEADLEALRALGYIE